MRQALAVILAALLAAPATARADGSGREPSPDLSARPRDEDPLLLMLAGDPDLRARAESGRNLEYGGGTLVVLGVVALPVGLVMYLSDSWATDGHAGPAGPLVVLGGTLSIAAGAALFRAGVVRRDDAVRSYRERHPEPALPP